MSFKFPLFLCFQKLLKLEEELTKENELTEELSRKAASAESLQQAVDDLQAQVHSSAKAEELAKQKKHELEEKLKKTQSVEEVKLSGILSFFCLKFILDLQCKK